MENPKAEYGWRPGAVVNVGIKSGPTRFTARVRVLPQLQVGRPQRLQPAPTSKLPTALKQFGGTVAGRLRKTTLLLAAYEGLRSLVGNAISSKVPNSRATNPIAPAGGCDQCCGIKRRRFNTALVSPVSLNTLGCTVGRPQPIRCARRPHPGSLSEHDNYVSSFPNTNISDNGIAKIDYHINSKHTVNGMLLIGNYSAMEKSPITAKYWQNKSPIRTYTVSADWFGP